MEAAVGLATFQFDDESKNNLIKFLKSKDFENLSIKEKKEFLRELKKSSYISKNLYTLFALSYERLLEKDDSTFSNLDTMMSVFVEEFNNIQMEELCNIVVNSKKCKKTTATELEAYFAEQFKNIQTEEFEEFKKNASDKQKSESSKLINLKEGTKIKFKDGSVAEIFYSSHDGYELQFEYHNGFTHRPLSCLINTVWEIVEQEEDYERKTLNLG